MDMKTDTQIMHKFDECMFLNRLGMVVLGIWPLDGRAPRLRIATSKIRLGIVYFFMMVLLCVQWFDMYSLWGNVEANTETFLSNAFTFAVMMKLSSYVKYEDTFRDIMQSMRANWRRVMNEAEPHNKDIMYNATVTARSRSNKYFLVTGATAVLYITMPFLRDSSFRDRKYPFFGKYYFDRDSDVVYLVCYMSQILTGSIIGLATHVTDTTFLICTYHFCAQLQILHNDFMDLDYDDHLVGRSYLISLIKRHQAEIRSAEALQSMFSQSSLQQILLSCLMICVNGFKLIVSLSNQDADVVMYLVCLVLTLLQILCYCEPGNELIVQSQSLDEAIYQSAWIKMDKNSIKNLSFIIQRSQKPVAITAGSIYELSLQNFMQ
ncbi:odorant receptor 13a-like isoform X2 [Phymastichus coffea]|nr:odorant receptor 13a-like isoform X2 [Phymastichus coffea]